MAAPLARWPAAPRLPWLALLTRVRWLAASRLPWPAPVTRVRLPAASRLPWPAAATLGLLALTACARPAPPPGPTPVPEPPQVRLLPGRGVEVDGHGTTQTDDITPQYDGGLNVGIDVVTLSHTGQSSFIVVAVQDQANQTETLTSAIGPYAGQRPLVVEGPVSFRVTADGDWSLKIQPMASGATPSFSGTGDAVSAYFDPPAPGTWRFSHQGQSTFFVYAHCLGGSIVAEDSSGAVQDSASVQFPRGPCFWEVRADGNFSLEPQ